VLKLKIQNSSALPWNFVSPDGLARILDNKGKVHTSNLTGSNRTVLQDYLELAGAKKGEEVRT
jgi:hypothetical protein